MQTGSHWWTFSAREFKAYSDWSRCLVASSSTESVGETEIGMAIQGGRDDAEVIVYAPSSGKWISANSAKANAESAPGFISLRWTNEWVSLRPRTPRRQHGHSVIWDLDELINFYFQEKPQWLRNTTSEFLFFYYLYYGFPIGLANGDDTEQWYCGKNESNDSPTQNLSPLWENVLAVIVRQNVQINQVKDPNSL